MSKIFLILFLSVSLFASSIGTIMAMKGSVNVKRDNQELVATSGMELQEKDTIITQKRSRAQIMLKDSTVVTVGPKSSFSFEEYSFDGANSKVSMRANRGFFRSVTGKIGKVAPERFKVKTASATIGIRGTDFSGDIAPDKEVIKCFSGVISVSIEGIGSRDIEAGMMIEMGDKKIEIKQIKSQENGSQGSGEKKSKQKTQTKATKSTKAEVAKKVQAKVEQNIGGVKVVTPTNVEVNVEVEMDAVQPMVGESLDVADVTMTEVMQEVGLDVESGDVEEIILDDTTQEVIDDTVEEIVDETVDGTTEEVVDDIVDDVPDTTVDDTTLDDVDDTVTDVTGTVTDIISEPFEVVPSGEDREIVY